MLYVSSESLPFNTLFRPSKGIREHINSPVLGIFLQSRDVKDKSSRKRKIVQILKWDEVAAAELAEDAGKIHILEKRCRAA
jgi:hypothetical protein